MMMGEHILPALYINMAGEMMYILEQRLRAQKETPADREKSGRVLKEIILAILSKSTLDEVFRSKGLPSKKNLKMLYEKLAHVSIMRLNDNSMDKLFDLITMATKFAMQQIVMAEQIMTVMVNHLQGMLDIVPDNDEVKEAVERTYTMLFSVYRSFSPHSWHMLKCALLCWFQEARVKISMLLREKRQMSNGNFYLFIAGEPITLPIDGEPVGTVRYFENGIVSNTTTFPSHYEYKEFEVLPDGLNVERRSTSLGTNIYKNAESIRIQGGGGTSQVEPFKEGNEMLFMASIMSTNEKIDGDIIGMSLFENDSEESKYAKDCEKAAENIRRIDLSGKKKTLSNAVDEKIGRPPTAAKKTKKSKGASVLDMMDEAAARPATAKPKEKQPRPQSISRSSSDRPSTSTKKRSSSVKH